MGRFKTQLHVHPMEGEEFYWVLDSELVYEDNRATHTVPVGFPTNFASVPRWLWTFLPPYGKYTKASVIHDFCYSSRGTISRAEADLLFYSILKESKVGNIKAFLMYKFVSFFGARAWCNKK